MFWRSSWSSWQSGRGVILEFAVNTGKKGKVSSVLLYSLSGRDCCGLVGESAVRTLYTLSPLSHAAASAPDAWCVVLELAHSARP